MGQRLFDVVLRGYSRRQVDEFLTRVEAGEVTAREVREAEFDVVFRGYDRYQVADTLGEWLKELEAGTGK